MYLTWWPQTCVQNVPSPTVLIMIITSTSVVCSVFASSCLWVHHQDTFREGRRLYFPPVVLEFPRCGKIKIFYSVPFHLNDSYLVCRKSWSDSRPEKLSLMWWIKKEERGGFTGSSGRENLAGLKKIPYRCRQSIRSDWGSARGAKSSEEEKRGRVEKSSSCCQMASGSPVGSWSLSGSPTETSAPTERSSVEFTWSFGYRSNMAKTQTLHTPPMLVHVQHTYTVVLFSHFLQ